MLPGPGKYGIIISKIPVMQSGLQTITSEYLPHYIFSYCHSLETLMQFPVSRVTLVVVDLSGEIELPHEICQYYYSLMARFKDIRWVYMVGRSCHSHAQTLLAGPASTFIADSEPVSRLGEVLCSGEEVCVRADAEARIHQRRNTVGLSDVPVSRRAVNALTFSERKVLRLLAKGWGINQIASLLKKSNKTISAQKNSAMRRLSLRSNAQMYAWINSTQGIKELNVYSAFGE
ncbi:helix-turn-helix transcriptional regulator [Klebsiella oxytoca]|uniref:helix-turn-helix transcriptional regulator n=1 Tax=Klebsiella oxytoca TaxID=571 RepID=UPI00157A3A11|nr:LuxR C-terminal-related transcriptional regulator [Klebsiella oxytoca]